MNTFRHVVCVLSSALLIAPSAFAASDFLLELDGVAADISTGHQSVDVQSFSWGATNSGSVGAGGGAGAGKVNVQDLSMTARREASSGAATGRRVVAADSAAPTARDVTVKLPEAAAMKMCATGKHFAKATLTARAEHTVLEDVVVTACSTESGVSTVTLRGYTKTGHVTLMK